MVEPLTGPVPEGKQIFYQKQMTHHLLPEIDRAWLGLVTNCFLIRDPREVILSYIKKNNDPIAGGSRFCPASWRFSTGSARRHGRGPGGH